MQFEISSINDMLRAIAGSMEYPVIILVLVLIATTLVCAGSMVSEIFTEHRHLKVKMPQLMDALKGETGDIAYTIQVSGLLRIQKDVLIELTRHPELTPQMREALAVRLLEEEQSRFNKRVMLTDLSSKIGPMLGLLGTLIPLGPGIIALGQGDTYTLSQSLLTAFDTTIVGLLSAAVAMLISTTRKRWYSNYMSILEALTECVLEVEKNHAETE